MEKILTEELLNQIRLMSYDRGMTLHEQKKDSIDEVKKLYDPNYLKGSYKLYKVSEIQKMLNIINGTNNSETGVVDTNLINQIKNIQNNFRLPATGKIDFTTMSLLLQTAKGQQKKEGNKERKEEKVRQYKMKKNCKKLLSQKTNNPNKKEAQEIYKIFKYNIESSGTDEKQIYSAVKRINNKEIYKFVRQFIIGCTGINLPIIQYLQYLEFSTGAESLNPYSPTDLIQSTFNDEWLIKMEKILNKFSNGEKYTKEKNPNLIQKAIPPYVRELIHNLIPVGQFILSLTPAGSTVSGVLTIILGDLFDASIYLLADKDPYMAGLVVTMGVILTIPDLPISPKVMKYGKSIINKLAKKEIYNLTEQELEVLTDLAINEKKYTSLAKKQSIDKILKKTTEDYLKKTGANGFVKLLDFLVSKGYLTAEKLSKMTLQIGSTIITWDALANYVFKMKCKKSFSFGELFNEFGYEKMGSVVDKLQPFTKTEEDCKKMFVTDLQKEYKKEYEKLNKKEFEVVLIESINNLIKNNKVYSEKNSGEFSTNVGFIQNFLKAFIDSKKIKNVSSNFDWGYFNDKTKRAILIYQKLNGLKEDGTTNNKTLNKMLSDIKSNRYGDIKNYLKSNIDENKLKKIVYDNYSKKLAKIPSYNDSTIYIQQQSPILHSRLSKMDIIDKQECIKIMDDTLLYTKQN